MDRHELNALPTIRVEWEPLLDTVRGPAIEDSHLSPFLWIDTGQITCPMLLGEGQAEHLIDTKRLLKIPVWDATQCLALRAQFANSLCDGVMAQKALEALSSHQPFEAFDRVLAEVPIEATRWRDEERLAAARLICDWLQNEGYAPDPSPDLERRILEFPIRRG